MATLRTPSYIPTDRWPTDAAIVGTRINEFLDWLYHFIDSYALTQSIGIHGSADTRTLACVLSDDGSLMLVSDIDLVFHAPISPRRRAEIVQIAQEKLIETLGTSHISPGARISELVLTDVNPSHVESSGLNRSAKSRGKLLDAYISQTQSTLIQPDQNASTKCQLAPREMLFALPYSLLRFAQWASIDATGYAAGVYELVKGVSRTLWGDTDLVPGSMRIYHLPELEHAASDQLKQAVLESFGDEFWAAHEQEMEAISVALVNRQSQREFSNTAAALRAIEWPAVLRSVRTRWPSSVIAERINATLNDRRTFNDDI